jgi:PAS domain S-box-containing protein
LVGILLAAGLWAVADGLRIAAPTEAQVLFWNRITYVGVVSIPPTAVGFVAAYTGRERWLEPARFGPIVAASLVALAAVFTNQWHGLWRAAETVIPGGTPPVLVEELGALHVAWSVYVLLCVMPLITVFLLREYRTAESRIFRRQSALILVGLAIPGVTAVLYVADVTAVDWTPIGNVAFGAALTLAITRYRALDIVPIARRTVIESINTGVLVLDSDGRIVDLNPRAAELIDEPRGGLIGERAADLFSGYEAVREAIRNCVDGSRTVAIDGETGTRHYRANFSPVRDAGEHGLGRVVIFNDITEQVKRREELVERTEALERKNEQLDRFASVVSHDLRNPLNVAASRLELARADGDGEHLAAVADAHDRIDRMIDELLTLARAEQDPDGVEPVRLGAVADRAWESVATDGATLDLGDELGTVDGNPDLVLELFENLYRNAIEHNDGPVTVTVGRVDRPGAGFSVADDGDGIDAGSPERVFEHGFTTDGGGTGFGRSIVEQNSPSASPATAAPGSTS